jgi:hypothetical protein
VAKAAVCKIAITSSILVVASKYCVLWWLLFGSLPIYIIYSLPSEFVERHLKQFSLWRKKQCYYQWLNRQQGCSFRYPITTTSKATFSLLVIQTSAVSSQNKPLSSPGYRLRTVIFVSEF